MTGPEHYRVAESLTDTATGVMDYEHGIYSSMSTEERLRRRTAFLAEAQVHATLAVAEATIAAATMRPEGHDEWDRATGVTS